MFEMKEMTSVNDIMLTLNDLSKVVNDVMLIIDGNTLSVILSNQNAEERFFEVSKNSPSVCICRCSPT